MNIQEYYQQVKGYYYLISPYHKGKKKLPFNIIGYNLNNTLEVYTVEYKGLERNDVYTDYKPETIQEFIENGLIKPYPLLENGKLNKRL